MGTAARAEGRERNAPDVLVARGKAVTALPVADPLWRDVDQRLAGFEGRPVRRQAPDAIGQDADEDVFGWEGAASVVAQPAQVPCDDAHVQGRLQGSSLSVRAIQGRLVRVPQVAALLALL